MLTSGGQSGQRRIDFLFADITGLLVTHSARGNLGLRLDKSLSTFPNALMLQFQVAGAETGAQRVLSGSRPFEVRGKS